MWLNYISYRTKKCYNTSLSYKIIIKQEIIYRLVADRLHRRVYTEISVHRAKITAFRVICLGGSPLPCFNPVLAVPLRPIQQAVGSLHQFPPRAGAVAFFTEKHAGAERHGAARDSGYGAFQITLDPADDLCRLLRVGPRKEKEELLAAVTAENIAWADALPRDARESVQDPVARHVAAVVVDLLEVVEIDHAERERLVVPGAREGIERTHQAVLVQDPGLRIEPQLFLPRVFFPDAVRNIAEKQDGAPGAEIFRRDPVDLKPPAPEPDRGEFHAAGFRVPGNEAADGFPESAVFTASLAVRAAKRAAEGSTVRHIEEIHLEFPVCGKDFSARVKADGAKGKVLINLGKKAVFIVVCDRRRLQIYMNPSQTNCGGRPGGDAGETVTESAGCRHETQKSAAYGFSSINNAAKGHARSHFPPVQKDEQAV